MKRIHFAVILLLTVLVFPGCKKESDKGGIRFSFTSNQAYNYTSFQASVSSVPYGASIKQAHTNNVKKSIELTELNPGTYYWYCSINFTSPQSSGSSSFNGEIIITEGKMMHITLED
jgi:hypothetical protein